MTEDQWRQWKQDHPKFPLTVHPSGSWCRGVCGKMMYFGKLDDVDAALKRWKRIKHIILEVKSLRKQLKEERKLRLGEAAVKAKCKLTVNMLYRKWIAGVKERVTTGRLAQSTLECYECIKPILKRAGVGGLLVESMRPEEFIRISGSVEYSPCSLKTQSMRITTIKSMFRWGHEMGWYPALNYGPRFVPANLLDIRKEQEDRGIVRFIERETILAAMKAASPKLELAILLGINCGFYASDTVHFAARHMRLETPIPYHNLRRTKTRQKRMAVLWPETVDLTTRFGHLLEGVKHPNLNVQFTKLLKKLGLHTPGVGLGSLRHTFASVTSEIDDAPMLDLAMGHTPKTMRERCYVQVNLGELDRLKVIADKAHDWLYGKVTDTMSLSLEAIENGQTRPIQDIIDDLERRHR